MNKFKVGDSLNLKPYDEVGDAAGISREVWNEIRRSGPVTVVGETDDGCVRCNTGYCGAWIFHHSAFVCPNKIVITESGKTVLARLYDGNEIIKSAEAKCSPTDTYDFSIGANLAYNRLMYGTDYHPAEVALAPEVAEEEDTAVREVKREAKVGEKIKIVAVGIHTVTDVHHDGSVQTDRGNVFLKEEHKEYVVLEAVTPFDWDAFRAGKIAVHCDTEEKAKAFWDECTQRGVTAKISASAQSVAQDYKDKLCISTYLDNGKSYMQFAPVSYYKNKRIIIDYPFTAQDNPKDLDGYEWVEGYKDFDKNLVCEPKRGHRQQYEIGKEYDLGHEEEMCESGYHFSKTLYDVHRHYQDNGENRFCKVSGLVKIGQVYDGKYCARKIKILEEVQKHVELIAKMYCVKDNPQNGVYGLLELKRGEIYTINANGKISFNPEPKHGYTYKSAEDFLSRNRGYAKCLVPLVSRPAKVGEWVLLNKANYCALEAGKIYKIEKQYGNGASGVVGKIGAHGDGLWCVHEPEYLVLDGYQPEPEKCKCCGQVIKGEQS
jgi:hypothetical protein